MKSVCSLPLTTAQRRLGVMSFGRSTTHHHTESEIAFLQQVARQVAVAVDNVLNFESAQAYQRQLARERDRLRVLLEVNNAVVSQLDLHDLLSAIAASLRRVIHHEYTSLALFDSAKNQMRVMALDFPQGKGLIHEEMIVPLDGSIAGKAFRSRQPLVLDRAGMKEFKSPTSRMMQDEGVRSVLSMPLISHNRVLGTISLASLRDAAFQQGDVDLLFQVSDQMAIAVENALAFQEIAVLKNKLAQEKLYLEDEIRSEMNFDEIVGEGASLRAILKQVETVAPTDSTVLITGETGTGKELIARAIHNLSPRRERTFVKVNCAAIPTGLLESELFGHERGAFTGAIAQRIGRFELAHGGTIFLDEVGDIPLELQPKLLRVLQEQEFERLGGAQTIRVDVRLVAATNRDLDEMVAARTFRTDLYYRLRRLPASHAALARTTGGYSRARALLRGKACPPHESHGGNDSRRNARPAGALPVARKYPRTGKLDRARGDCLARPRASCSAQRPQAAFRTRGGQPDTARRRTRSHPQEPSKRPIGCWPDREGPLQDLE